MSEMNGHVCGSGAIYHKEFAMASGEMSVEEFINFLKQNFLLAGMMYSRAPQMAGLWGIPDGFAVLCLQNLLIVAPTPLSWLYWVRTPNSTQT